MKKFYRSSVMTVLLFIMAVVLLFGGTVGSTQAALQYFSDDYQTQIRLSHIGVSLLESTRPGNADPAAVSYRYYGSDATGTWTEYTGNLIKNMVSDAGETELKVGEEYPFFLSVQNRGSIDEYVRVTLYRYWVDSTSAGNEYGWYNGNGTKRVDLDPSLIEITPYDSTLWTVEDTTDERMVFYYQNVLGPDEITSVPLTQSLRISPEITKLVYTESTTITTTEGSKTVTTYVYAYNDMKFVVEAEVDAVQARHSEQSLPSAWGRGLS